jgi:hypothetical protein
VIAADPPAGAADGSPAANAIHAPRRAVPHAALNITPRYSVHG